MIDDPRRLLLRAGDLTVAALSWGDETGPLALCLHGYPDTPWTWRHLGPHLARRGWRVVAPYARGYAPSDLAPDDDYTISAQARDALALREALHGDDRAVLVGHDWGAVTAHWITAHAPGAFRRVATLAIPPMPTVLDLARSVSTWPQLGRQLQRSWYMGFNALPWIAERSQDGLIPRLWAEWSPGYDARVDLEHVAEALRDPARARAATGYYRAALTTGQGLRDAFAVAPRQPVLLVHGDRDGCMGAEVATRRPHRMAPGSRIELVEGAGHFSQLERPDVVNEVVTDWLER